jgi:chromosome segregation ATPase
VHDRTPASYERVNTPQVTVASIRDDLAVQKSLVTDLRSRLSDVTNQVNTERRKLGDLAIQKDEEHLEASLTIEALQEKLDHNQHQLASCHNDHASTKGTHENISRVCCLAHVCCLS